MTRRAGALRRTFAHDASYMVEDEEFTQAGGTYPVDETLEYSRPFRSLKLWMALRAHGAGAFKAAVETNLDQARQVYADVVAHPRMEPMLGLPDLTVVPFRRVPRLAGSAREIDTHNARLARALQADGRVYVTGAVIDGRACLRPCIVNFRTTDDDVRAIVEVAEEIGTQLEAGDS